MEGSETETSVCVEADVLAGLSEIGPYQCATLLAEGRRATAPAIVPTCD